MEKESKTYPGNEESPIPKSIQLELLATTVALIAEALSIWALLESLDEIEIETKKAQENEASLQEQFKEMQEQINELKGEIARLKKNDAS